MARSFFPIAKSYTQAELDAGAGTNDQEVFVLNSTSSTVLWSGPVGTAPEPATASAGAAASSIPSSLVGTGAIALTQALHSGKPWHAEPGTTAVTITAADWADGGELSLINHAGGNFPIQVGAGMTGYDNAKGGQSVVGNATPVTLVTLAYLERAVIQVKDGAFLNVAVVGGGPSEEGWTANTIYRQGTIVRAPSVQGTIGAGDRIIRGTAGKSRAAFDATEAALWAEVAEDPDVVHLAGAQTVTGVKTFSALPEFGADATTANQPMRKSQTDAALDRKAGKAIVKDRDTVTDGLSGRLIHLRSDALAAGAVSAWNDESGAGNNFTGTGTAQPTATASAIGTRTAVRFDGTNDVVSRSSVNLGTDWTIATLVRTGASLAGQILSDSYPNAVSYMLGLNTSSFLGGTANALCVGGFTGPWAGAAAPTAAVANTVYLVIATRTQGGNYVLRVNGTQVATGAAGTNPTFEGSGTLYVGKRWDNSASEFWTGDIGEVQMFNRVLTADELQLMEGMLAWKYGQQTLLPVAHTYSADPPAVINVPVPVSTMSTATTTTSGLMSATDKTKLDSVATSAAAVATTGTPAMDGTAALGTATTAAHSDHVHPADTSKAPIVSPTFTGTPAAPTATTGTNTTQLATTAFVKTAVDGAVAGLLDYRGAFTPAVASGAAGYPTTGGSGTSGAILKGDAFAASAAGFILTEAIQAGDWVVAKIDAPGQTASNWDRLNANVSYAPEDQANKVTSLSVASTDTQYPSAKLAYDQLVLKEATANKGVANGYASLGSDTRVPAAQLPAFATSLRLMVPADIIQSANLAINLLADDLALGAVATWANPGTGGDFAQATTGSQPTVAAVANLGGRRAALFADDFMETANISLGTRYGLFAVFIPTALANQYILSEAYVSTVEYAFGLQASKFFVGHFNGGWRTQEAVSPTPVINTPYILAAGYDGANLHVKVNGAAATTVAQTSDPTLTDPGNIRLGRRWDGTTDIFDGHIACVVAKQGAYFTATELARLEGWAAWYYGLVANLPGTHTYAVAPPLITT